MLTETGCLLKTSFMIHLPDLGTAMTKIEVPNFQAGILTKNGFLGSDSRSIEEIIRADQQRLSQSHLENAAVAGELQRFIDEGKKRLEDQVRLGNFKIRVQWDRGMLPCPFAEPGLHPKITITVCSENTGEEIRYSQLSVHLIRRHGFFGGQGSCFRLEPEKLIEFFKEDQT